MKIRFVAGTMAAAALCAFATAAIAAPPVAPAAPTAADAPITAAFTDSTAAGLAATKRVAITSVTIAFQSSTAGMAGPGMFFRMFQPKDEVLTVLQMPNMPQSLQDALAEGAYKALAEELTAAGFEVVPEAQVKASANYAAILKQAGYANRSRYANAMGDIALVGPTTLPLYTAYSGELGLAFNPSKTYLGWVSGFGQNSTTPGGLSYMKQGNAWKVPGLEVALAKELNANVVKAHYVISLGKASSKRSTGYSSQMHQGLFLYKGDVYSGNYTTMTRTVTGTGNAFAQVGLVSDQSHIAFRTPTGNAKWQKVSMMKISPPKDGDVVVRLADPIIGGTDYFNLTEGDIAKTGGFFTQQQRGDINLAYTATISDPAAYGREVMGMLVAADRAMLALVKQ